MSTATTTLIAEASALSKHETRLPAGSRVEATVGAHEFALASLWYAAYPREIASNIAEAQQEIRDMFAGEFGSLWPEASPLVSFGAELAAGICTVVKAPWERTPTCPFIIDLMVHPDFRRQGMASFLIQAAARAVLRDRKTHLALRVTVDNAPAISLYRKLGFTEWDGR